MDNKIKSKFKGCKCQICSCVYTGDLMVSDDIWSKINQGRNLLCAKCILDSIVDLSIWTAGYAINIDER